MLRPVPLRVHMVATFLKTGSCSHGTAFAYIAILFSTFSLHSVSRPPSLLRYRP
jgi:hypothetical protein